MHRKGRSRIVKKLETGIEGDKKKGGERGRKADRRKEKNKRKWKWSDVPKYLHTKKFYKILISLCFFS